MALTRYWRVAAAGALMRMGRPKTAATSKTRN